MAVSLGLFLYRLFGNKRQKSHDARTLDGKRQMLLILGSELGLPFVHNTAVGIEELLQNCRVLVVDVFNVIR